MARRKKVVYPAKRQVPGAAAAADARAADAASRTVTINLAAMTGRPEIRQGGRVTIMSGLYAGETATVESIVGGVIPAAVVRTEAGRTRRIRTVDLVVSPATESPKANEEPKA